MIISPPTLKHLSRLYYELSKMGARSLGEKTPWPYHYQSLEELFCLASDLSRYDPRLFSVLVDWLCFNWKKLNPFLIREQIPNLTTPQTLGVIFGFMQSSEISDKENKNFASYVLQDLKPASLQFYFRELYPHPKSRLAILATNEPLEQFYDWGFLARERPVLYEKNRRTLGTWGGLARQNIIARLAHEKNNFNISDYLNELDHTISRQQAVLDLKQSPLIHSKGLGRGSFWKARQKIN